MKDEPDVLPRVQEIVRNPWRVVFCRKGCFIGGQDRNTGGVMLMNLLALLQGEPYMGINQKNVMISCFVLLLLSNKIDGSNKEYLTNGVIAKKHLFHHPKKHLFHYQLL